MKTLTLLFVLIIASTSYSQNDSIYPSRITSNTLMHSYSVKIQKVQQIQSVNGLLNARTTAAAGDSVYTFFLPELSISQIGKSAEVIYG